MGSCVHLLPVLLVLEHNGNILGVMQELGVGVQEYLPGGCTKDKASQSDSFGSTWPGRLGVLAGSHCEEESSEYEVCNVCERLCFSQGASLGTEELEKFPEEFWGDGFLSIGRWVGLVEGLQKGPDGGE